MARAYPTQNKRIGSVGGEVYSVVKGQLIVRAKPVQVANPRTPAQMRNRVLFTNAVRFYQRSLQAYYKYAFSSKKQQESDYNTFMRMNVRNSRVITPQMSQDPRWPALGDWQVAEGPVQSLQVEDLGTAWSLVIRAASAAVSTVGHLSREILRTYPALQAGDIITLVSIRTALTGIDSTTLEATYEGDDTPVWFIVQFKLNTEDTRQLQEIGATPSQAGDEGVNFGYNSDEGPVYGSFAVVSRETASGTVASNASVVWNSAGEFILSDMSNEERIQRELQMWGMGEEAILQGSRL